ncbi:MAG: hypothetical protein JNM81_08935 [Rhodospirillaceae bacterium]|nr:hypothetical protein [Rhodospirillaceae bacterium]
MASASSTNGGKVSEAWRTKVAGTLINPDTLLATDYMNHFNEVVMLIEMLPDMPDMLPDCAAWKTKSYPQHFLDSRLDYGHLAAEAYEHVPPDIIGPFELTVAQLNAVIALTIKRAAAAIAKNASDETRFAVDAGITTLRKLSDTLGGIINGSQQTLDQAHIDAMMAGSELSTSLVTTTACGSTQDDIDKLFD